MKWTHRVAYWIFCITFDDNQTRSNHTSPAYLLPPCSSVILSFFIHLQPYMSFYTTIYTKGKVITWFCLDATSSPDMWYFSLDLISKVRFAPLFNVCTLALRQASQDYGLTNTEKQKNNHTWFNHQILEIFWIRTHSSPQTAVVEGMAAQFLGRTYPCSQDATVTDSWWAPPSSAAGWGRCDQEHGAVRAGHRGKPSWTALRDRTQICRHSVLLLPSAWYLSRSSSEVIVKACHNSWLVCSSVYPIFLQPTEMRGKNCQKNFNKAYSLSKINLQIIKNPFWTK